MLRRENAELRQQLLQLASATRPPSADVQGATLPASFWLDAQLRHKERQIQILSDALVLKAELTADLEGILLQLRSVENGPPAQWCKDALRRVRGVNFAEELGGQLRHDDRVSHARRAPAAGRGANARCCGAIQGRRGPTTSAPSA